MDGLHELGHPGPGGELPEQRSRRGRRALAVLAFAAFSPILFAHDVVIPHHQEDFEALAEKRPLIVLITAAFVFFLAAIVSFAYRRSDESKGSDDLRPEQERLKRLAIQAANAALALSEAAATDISSMVLRAYADAARQPYPSGDAANSRPVRIGDDDVSVTMLQNGTVEIVASTKYAGARVVTERAGSFSTTVFAVRESSSPPLST